MVKTFTITFLLGLVLLNSTPLFSQENNYFNKFNEVQSALNKGDAGESYILIDDLIVNYPDSSDVWYLKSQIERMTIQYRKALESLSRAMILDPSNPTYYYQKSILYSDIQDYKRSIAYCDSVLEMDSTHLFASILKAQALVKNGDQNKALNQYNSLHKRDSLNINFIKQIGSLYNKMDSLDYAIKWYSHALTIDSTDIPSYTHLGNLFVRTEKYEEGIPLLTTAIEMDSLNSWLYRFRGSLNIMGAKLEEAEYDFKRAISLGDSTAFTFRHLGLSLFKQSKYEEALPVYQTTVSLDSEDSQAWYYLGFCYKWQEDITRAIECMEVALKQSVTPGIASVYNGLAQFQAIEREYEKAMHYYSRAYEWDNSNPVPLAQLGMLVEQTGGDKSLAKKYYLSYLEKADQFDIELKAYIESRLQVINEKLFMEGKLEKSDEMK